MNLVWSRELKRVGLVLGIIFLGSILIVNVLIGIYANQTRKEYNRLLTSIFGNIVTCYPEVPEEELIQVLNTHTGENFDVGVGILAQYGVFQNYGSESFVMREKGIHFLYFSIIIFILILFIVLFFLLLQYLGKRQKKISDLKDYMGALNHDNYRLELEDNADDELSGLRNEIYKLTVLLKEQANRAIEQRHVLADSMANISHQLKTPLTSVTILTNNMSENLEMDVLTRQRFLSEITRQLTDMSWLITVLLKLSRVDAGVVEFQHQFCSMETIVNKTIQKLEIAAEWKAISILTDIPESAGFYVDEKWMVEALMNIVKNAIEHSSSGNRVEIVGEVNGVYTQILVKDYGEGMSEEEREKLFQRFYNGDTAREDSIGIGLSLAKEIIEKQGGYISVDSQIGKGTVFKIRFVHTSNHAVNGSSASFRGTNNQ